MTHGPRHDDLPGVRLTFLGRVLTRHAAGGSFVLGREAPADVRIDHPAISRLHARVWPGRCWKLIDFDSRNGIYLGGVRVRGEMDVIDGMTVTLGAPEGIEVTFAFVPANAGGNPDGQRVADAVLARAEELGLRDDQLPASTRAAFDDLLTGLRCGGHWPERDHRAAVEGALAWPRGALTAVRSGTPPGELTEVITPAVRQALLLDSTMLALTQIQCDLTALSGMANTVRAQHVSALRHRLQAIETTLVTTVGHCASRADLLGVVAAFKVLLGASG